MNIAIINDIVNLVKTQVGAGLMATDIWSTDALSLAGVNQQPGAVALFNQITRDMNTTLARSGFPGLDNYYMLRLEGKKLVFLIQELSGPMPLYQGILVDEEHCSLGILISVVLPQVRAKLKEAAR
jgi:hypothetical protein